MLDLIPPTRPDLRTTERRRWPRREVAWPVTMSLEGGGSVTGRVTDASRHGLRVALEDSVSQQVIREGTRCHVEVLLAGGQARFVRIGEVRHVGDYGVGLLVPKPLPIDPHRDLTTEDTAGRNHTDRANSVMAKLRPLTVPLLPADRCLR
jgi:PilZ domain-containing protein